MCGGNSKVTRQFSMTVSQPTLSGLMVPTSIKACGITPNKCMESCDKYVPAVAMPSMSGATRTTPSTDWSWLGIPVVLLERQSFKTAPNRASSNGIKTGVSQTHPTKPTASSSFPSMTSSHEVSSIHSPPSRIDAPQPSSRPQLGHQQLASIYH